MSNQAIKQAISNYLDAVEKKNGIGARNRTSVEYREGTDLVIRQGNKAPKLIDLGTLYSLTGMLRSGA